MSEIVPILTILALGVFLFRMEARLQRIESLASEDGHESGFKPVESLTTLDAIQAEFEVVRDDEYVTFWVHELFQVKGEIAWRTSNHPQETLRVRHPNLDYADIETSRRTATAALAMCEWLEKIQKERRS